MTSSWRRGSFITLEGGEGTGKSTQVRKLVDQLARKGIKALATREPGGSPGAEIIREVLLSGEFKALGPKAEAILFSAARIDHLEHTIKPAIAAGTWVICDRFLDSTRAYQGALGDIDMGFLQVLESLTLQGFLPDLTFILDLPAEQGLERASRRRGKARAADRFESEDMNFHRELRKAFREIASREPGRCVVIDASGTQEEVFSNIWAVMETHLFRSLAS